MSDQPRPERPFTTVPDDPEPRWDRHDQRLRTVAYVVVGLIVGASALGLLGVRTTTAGDSAGGYSVDVYHASITRAGLATPFSVTVRADDGAALPPEVTLRLDTDYLAMFDQNAVEPQPDRSLADESSVRWVFEDLQGRSELAVFLDARLEPAVQWGQDATVALEIDGEEVVTVDLSTWVMP